MYVHVYVQVITLVCAKKSLRRTTQVSGLFQIGMVIYRTFHVSGSDKNILSDHTSNRYSYFYNEVIFVKILFIIPGKYVNSNLEFLTVSEKCFIRLSIYYSYYSY
jgi:hypothetical protein